MVVGENLNAPVNLLNTHLNLVVSFAKALMEQGFLAICFWRRTVSKMPEHPFGTPCHTARRSGSWAIPSLCRATPSATSEHYLGLLGSSPIPPPFVTSCVSFQLRPLPRHYPASSVLRASPPPHTARPVSHELPVDPDCDHRWGFPCCVWSPVPACHRHYPGRTNGLVRSSSPMDFRFPRCCGGSAPALTLKKRRFL